MWSISELDMAFLPPDLRLQGTAGYWCVGCDWRVDKEVSGSGGVGERSRGGRTGGVRFSS